MARRSLMLALLAVALLPTAAAAQVTSAAEPNSTSAASRLSLGVDASAPAFGGRVPASLRLLLDRGFRLDLRTPAICGHSAGRNGGCPQYSQVATGTAVLEKSFLGGAPTEATASIDVYRTESTPAGALAGLMAIIDVNGSAAASEGVVRAVDEGPFGYEVRFDDLVGPTSPFGTTIRVKRFDVGIGASWREPVPVTRRVRCRQASRSRSCKPRPDCKRGRKCARYRTVREERLVAHHLLRNPSTCASAWASRTIATFEDGSNATVDAPIACKP